MKDNGQALVEPFEGQRDVVHVGVAMKIATERCRTAVLREREERLHRFARAERKDDGRDGERTTGIWNQSAHADSKPLETGRDIAQPLRRLIADDGHRLAAHDRPAAVGGDGVAGERQSEHDPESARIVES